MGKIKFIGGQFVGWLITTTQGTALLAVIWAAIVGVAAAFTSFAAAYAPLSYALAALLAFGFVIVTVPLGGLILTAIGRRSATSQETYVRFKIQNARVTVVSKSNVYKGPYIKQQESPVLRAKPNRHQKRAAIAQGADPVVFELSHMNLDAFFIVHFEKPIKTREFKFRIESQAGDIPTINDNSLDDRFSLFQLGNLKEGALFTVWFNGKEKEDDHF